MIEPKLSLEIIWQDKDLVEIQLIVDNGRFAGMTQVYTTYKELSDLLNSISGFPTSITHTIEFAAGDSDGYAYFSARFYCFDNKGHTAARIRLESNEITGSRKEKKDKVELELMFEAAAASEFEKQLKDMISKKEGTAILKGIYPYTYNIMKDDVNNK